MLFSHTPLFKMIDKWVLLAVCILCMFCKQSTTAEVTLDQIEYLAALNKAISENTENDSLLLYRAKLLLESKYITLASKDCKKAFEIKPSIAAAICQYQTLIQQGKIEDAIQWLIDAEKKVGTNNTLLFALAEAYWKKKSVTAATQLLNKMDTTHLSSHLAFDVATLLFEMQCHEDALRFVDMSILRDQQLSYYFMKIYLMIKTKKSGVINILKQLEKRKDIKDKKADLYYLYGSYYQAYNNMDKAYQYFEKTTNIDWRFQSAYIGKAQILKNKAQYREAIEQLYIASEVDNPTFTIMKETAECFLALKDTNEAIDYYQTAWKIDSTQIDIPTILKTLKYK